MYYITCETKCVIRFLPGCELVRELAPAKVWGDYCCSPSVVIKHLPRRLVVSIPHGLYSRADLEKIKGVVRVRTTDTARGGDVGHVFC